MASEDVYEVEAIRDQRYVRGKKQYLVKWKNYPEKDNTWEDAKNCMGCKEAMRKFEEEQREKHKEEKKKRDGSISSTPSELSTRKRQLSDAPDTSTKKAKDKKTDTPKSKNEVTSTSSQKKPVNGEDTTSDSDAESAKKGKEKQRKSKGTDTPKGSGEKKARKSEDGNQQARRFFAALEDGVDADGKNVAVFRESQRPTGTVVYDKSAYEKKMKELKLTHTASFENDKLFNRRVERVLGISVPTEKHKIGYVVAKLAAASDASPELASRCHFFEATFFSYACPKAAATYMANLARSRLAYGESRNKA